MARPLNEYKYVIMDASFFVAPFPKELVDQLGTCRICIPNTFFAEAAQFRLTLGSREKGIFEENYRILKEKVLDTGDSETVLGDIWQLIDQMQDDEAGTLLITSNRVLIQRIVLRNIRVDIYDLAENVFIPVNEQERKKADCEFIPVETSYPWEIEDLRNELEIYRENGTKLSLIIENDRGAEALIYAVQSDNTQLAKILQKDKLSPGKILNVEMLKKLGKRMDVPWALFPKEIVYYDEDGKHPAGFLQHFVTNAHKLEDDPVYLGDIAGDYDESCRKTKHSVTVDLCLRIVRQIAVLNVQGVYVSDFNYANFAWKIPAGADRSSYCPEYVYMWDTDSFCSRYYRPSSFAQEMPKQYRSCGQSNADAIELCTEMLYVFILNLLTLGGVIWADASGSITIEPPREENKWRYECVPQNLWSLFVSEFGQGQQQGMKHSVDALLHELMIASNELHSHPENDRTYEEIQNSEGKQENTQESGSKTDTIRNVRQRRRVILKDAENPFRRPVLMNVQHSGPLLTPSEAHPRHRVPVSRLHYRRYNARPPRREVYRESKKPNIRQWFLMVLLVVLLWMAVQLFSQEEIRSSVENVLRMGWEGLEKLTLTITDLWNQFIHNQ